MFILFRFHPEGSHILLSGGEDKVIYVWDSKKAKLLAKLTGMPNQWF